MAIVYDENGDELEAFTTDEVDAKIQEEIKKTEALYQEKLKVLEARDAKAKEALSDTPNNADKEMNFKRLREAKENAEKDLESFKAETYKKFDELRAELSRKEINEKINSLAGGDVELAKKIDKHYGSFKLPKDGEEDNRIELAYRLAIAESPRLPNYAIRSGMGQVPTSKPQPGKLTNEQIELGKSLGLSDKDLGLTDTK